MTSAGAIILLSKPPHGPPLYWHQDATYWNHPMSALPWPSRVFLSYYLVDTTRENGCLRIIPGTHRKRTELHDLLPDAHSPEMQRADETHLAFTEQPGEIDIPVQAGDLVIADGRVLHAAWPNNTDTRRTLVLEWWDLFPFPSVPDLVGRRATPRSPRRSPRHLRTLPQAHPLPPLRWEDAISMQHGRQGVATGQAVGAQHAAPCPPAQRGDRRGTSRERLTALA